MTQSATVNYCIGGALIVAWIMIAPIVIDWMLKTKRDWAAFYAWVGLVCLGVTGGGIIIHTLIVSPP